MLRLPYDTGVRLSVCRLSVTLLSRYAVPRCLSFSALFFYQLRDLRSLY